MGSPAPIRVDLFDDEIDSLRTFDPDSQRTLERITEIQLLPAKEFPFDDPAIARFREQWHNTFNVDVRRCSVYQDVSNYIVPNGIEYYLPFFFDQLGTLFDYLSDNTVCLVEPGVGEAAEQHWTSVQQRYESLRHDIERPILPPHELFTPLDAFYQQLNNYVQVRLQADESAGSGTVAFPSQPLPDLLTDPKLLGEFVADQDQPTLFIAETQGRREIFSEFLARYDLRPQAIDDLGLISANDQCYITVADIQQGTITDDLIIVTETDVLGTKESSIRSDPEQGFVDPDLIFPAA